MQIEHALIGSHNSAVCSAEPLDLAVVVSQLAAYCYASLHCYMHGVFSPIVQFYCWYILSWYKREYVMGKAEGNGSLEILIRCLSLTQEFCIKDKNIFFPTYIYIYKKYSKRALSCNIWLPKHLKLNSKCSYFNQPKFLFFSNTYHKTAISFNSFWDW